MDRGVSTIYIDNDEEAVTSVRVAAEHRTAAWARKHIVGHT